MTFITVIIAPSTDGWCLRHHYKNRPVPVKVCSRKVSEVRRESSLSANHDQALHVEQCFPDCVSLMKLKCDADVLCFDKTFCMLHHFRYKVCEE